MKIRTKIIFFSSSILNLQENAITPPIKNIDPLWLNDDHYICSQLYKFDIRKWKKLVLSPLILLMYVLVAIHMNATNNKYRHHEPFDIKMIIKEFDEGNVKLIITTSISLFHILKAYISLSQYYEGIQLCK